MSHEQDTDRVLSRIQYLRDDLKHEKQRKELAEKRIKELSAEIHEMEESLTYIEPVVSNTIQWRVLSSHDRDEDKTFTAFHRDNDRWALMIVGAVVTVENLSWDQIQDKIRYHVRVYPEQMVGPYLLASGSPLRRIVELQRTLDRGDC